MGYRDYSTAKGRIVDATGKGDFTTIQAAINAATSGDTIFIRPGTYTENLSLKIGVNLCAYGPVSNFYLGSVGKVIIVGKASLSAAGRVGIFGCVLQTNSDYAVEITGSVASEIMLEDCYLNCTNNTGLHMGSSSASATLNCFYCTGDLTTTGIALFLNDGVGSIRFIHSMFGNSGGSTTANSCTSSGSFFPNYSGWANATAIGGTANMNGSFLNMIMSGNQTALTVTSTGGASNLQDSTLGSNTSSAVSIGSGASLQLHDCFISSSNGSPIAGSGTLIYSNITYNSVFGIGTSTILNPFPSTDAWKFVDAMSASSSANIVFSRGMTVQHLNYMLDIAGFVPATNAVNFNLEFSSNGGSTWLNSGFSIKTSLMTTGGIGETNSTALVPLTQSGNTMQNTSGEGWSGQIMIQTLNNGLTSRVTGRGSYYTSNAHFPVFIGGRGPAATAINALRLSMSSGNISTGYATLYALL